MPQVVLDLAHVYPLLWPAFDFDHYLSFLLMFVHDYEMPLHIIS